MNDNIYIADRVIARWKNNLYYAGKVDSIKNNQIHVLFDDGYSVTHSIQDISAVILDQAPEPHQVSLGTHVVSSYPGSKKFYIGYVTSKHSNVFMKVTFDDNDSDARYVKQLRIFPEHSSPYEGKWEMSALVHNFDTFN